jgi:hypothetical protein
VEVLCSTLGYSLLRDGDLFYMHPLGQEAVVPGPPSKPDDMSKWQVFRHRPRLRPCGACLHCDRPPEAFFLRAEGTDSDADAGEGGGLARALLAKAYDYATGVWTLWGNFCDFPCALQYESEHPSYNTPYVLALTQKLAIQVWGRPGPVRPAPPRICLARYGGHVPLEDLAVHATQSRVRLREASCVSYVMMVEVQALGSRSDRGGDASAGGIEDGGEGSGGDTAPALSQRGWTIRGIRARRAPATPRLPGRENGAIFPAAVLAAPAAQSPVADGSALFDQFVAERARAGGREGAVAMPPAGDNAPRTKRRARRASPARARAPRKKPRRSPAGEPLAPASAADPAASRADKPGPHGARQGASHVARAPKRQNAVRANGDGVTTVTASEACAARSDNV